MPAHPGLLLCLQPLAGDWRERLKAGKAEAGSPEQVTGKAAPAAAPAAAPVSDGRPDLAALTRGLPKGWRAMWDKQSREVYYGNLGTKVRA